MTTSVFTLILPEENVIGAEPGVATSVAANHALLLDGLPEGEHVITIANPDITVTYQLTVAAPEVAEQEVTPAATPGT